jgi:flagellar assembly protein FliH
VAAVRLHPADIAVLKAAGLPQGTGVELVPDPSLARGDAMAEYPQGWLDARLGTALARARSALLGPEPQAPVLP